jgi:hypothetical protein
MKKLGLTLILTPLFAFGTLIKAQELKEGYLGLPGDNLNLYAVMELFQKSKTLEDFERSLNDKDTRINNLDLNGDDQVDYLTVTDHVDGISHTIVLQDALGQNDNQDVAVFTVQKYSDGTVQIQLIGDESLYGKNYIIEPNYDNNGEYLNQSYMEQRDNVQVILTTPHEVAYWPVIRFIYGPDYVVWHSLWYWGHYPYYWHHWNPFAWHYYNGYHSNLYPEYYSHYRHWNLPRYTHFNSTYYHGFRAYSPQVNNRIREGRYRATYAHPEMRHDGEAYYSRTHSGRPPSTGSSPLHSSPDPGTGNNRMDGPKMENSGSYKHNTPSYPGNNGNGITPGNNPVNHGTSHTAPENQGSFKHNTPSYHGNNGNNTTPRNNPVNHGSSHPAPEYPSSFKHNTPSYHGNNGNNTTPRNNPVNHGTSHTAPEYPSSFKHNTPSSPGNNGNGITPGNNPINHGTSHNAPENPGSFKHSNPTYTGNNSNSQITPGNNPINHSSSHPAHENSGSFHNTNSALPAYNKNIGSSAHSTSATIKPNTTFPERGASSPQKNHSDENFNSMKKPAGNINQGHNQAPPVSRNIPTNKPKTHK